MRKVFNGALAFAALVLFSAGAVAQETAARGEGDEVAPKQWNFLKEQSSDNSVEIANAVLNDLDCWLKLNSDRKMADAALSLKGDMQLRIGDHKSAVVTYIKHFYEFPESNMNFSVKSNFNTIVGKKIDKKLRDILIEIAKGDTAKSKSERLAIFLNKMSAQTGDELYEPMIAEFKDFFVRFPDYGKSDELALSLGQLYLQKANYLAAIMEYEKIPAVYPSSAYRAKAKRMVGDVYANNLKKYDKAIDAYQQVVNKYPDSDEAGVSYEQIAKLAEIQKQYDLAVEVYEKMVKLYPGKDAAYNALKNEARLNRDALKKPQDAVNALTRLADMFKGDKAIDALKQAAEVARKDVKDFSLEISMYDRIVAEYPDSQEAPKALFETAKIYEKDMQNPDKAVDIYQQVINKYPANSIVKSAESRIKSLTKN